MAKSYEIVMINGKDYPCRFGMAALMEYTKQTNTKINDLGNLGNDMTMEQAITLCWCGLKDGARKAKKQFDMETVDIADLLDDDPNAIEKIMEVFAAQFNTEMDDEGNVKAGKKVRKK
jgi:hypothetical protein